jgi:putative aldouronate transport system permease protein
MKNSEIQSAVNVKYSSSSNLIKTIISYKYFYLMILPVVIWYIVFAYTPMYGVTLAFKSYDYSKGIIGSPWIGLDNFKQLLTDVDFWSAFKNTLTISFGKLFFHFPLPIVLAIVLNEFSNDRAKKFFQTVFTFPHFISWVVLSGIITNIFSTNGAFNQIITALGFSNFSPLVDTDTFRPMIYLTHIWKEIGWDSIIYLAALAGINPELYEAADMDGANRFQRIIHITWPGIRSTVSILLILAVGNLMSMGSSFDQIFNLYSSPVYSVADTIDTFVYRTTFTTGANFGYMTSIGLLKSVINLILIFVANTAVKKMGEEGLY